MTDARIRTSADELRLSPELVHILLHALGIQKRGRTWSMGGWRNHYSTHRNADSFALCQRLEADGWLHGFAGPSSDGEAWTFRVTAAGAAALRLCGWSIEVEAA